MKTQSLDDLEMFELLQACYPERFPNDEDETFEAALNFAEELSGFGELADLLGRVVMLTMPMKSGLTERLSHCLGRVEFENGSASMVAAVRRDAVTPNAGNERPPLAGGPLDYDDRLIVHDDVPHPEDMTFDEEERPQ